MSTTRSRLIDAVDCLLREHGDESAVTVRAIEHRAGVTAPTIYRYFADKNALVAEVAERYFAGLADAVGSVPATEDPVADLLARGRVVASFGLANPQAYRVLFMGPVEDPARAVERMRRLAGQERLVEAAVAGVARGALPADSDPERIANLLVLAVHGVVSMLIVRPHGWGDHTEMVDHMVRTVGRGIAVPAPVQARDAGVPSSRPGAGRGHSESSRAR